MKNQNTNSEKSDKKKKRIVIKPWSLELGCLDLNPSSIFPVLTTLDKLVKL